MRHLQPTYFALSLALLLCIGCGSAAGITGDSLVPLAGIETPEDAKRGLVIAQEVRYSTLKVVKQSTEERKEKFRSFDNVFRPTWAAADDLVVRWELLGERPLTFNDLYKIILETAVDMLQLKEATNELP